LNYVIQNLSLEYATIDLTPRIKFFFFLRNVNLFFFFYITNFFNFFFKKISYFFMDYTYMFIKFFFFNQIRRIFKKIDLNTLSFYDNRLTKSYLFWIFFFILKNLKTFKTSLFSFFVFSKFYSLNISLLSIKVANHKINVYLFKSVFFFFFFFTTHFYINNFFFLKFLSTSLLVTPETSLHPFYNGYFLNIYSF
jgi:hypothetical protein